MISINSQDELEIRKSLESIDKALIGCDELALGSATYYHLRQAYLLGMKRGYLNGIETLENARKLFVSTEYILE